MLLELTEKEMHASGQKGHAAWLGSGLKIQEMQYGFDTFIRNTPNNERETTQIASSSACEENRIMSNTSPAKGHCLKALTATRKS